MNFILEVLEGNLRQLYSTEGLLKALNSFSQEESAGGTTKQEAIQPAKQETTDQVWTKFQMNFTLGKFSTKIMAYDAKGNL